MFLIKVMLFITKFYVFDKNKKNQFKSKKSDLNHDFLQPCYWHIPEC